MDYALDHPRRVLVVKLADMGDVLTATPALREVRLGWPEARVTALVTPHTAVVLRHSDAVDEIVALDKFAYDREGRVAPVALARAVALGWRLNKQRFDAILLLHHLTTVFGGLKYRLLVAAAGVPVRAGLDNGRGDFLSHRAPDRGFGALHEVDYCRAVVHAAGLPLRQAALPLEMPVAGEDQTWAAARLGNLEQRGRPLVAIHPGAGPRGPERRWSVAGFRRVAAEMARRGAAVVAVGGHAERHLTAQTADEAGQLGLSLGGETSLHQLAAVLARCQLFIGSESGVMHVAAAVGTRCLAIFGPGNPDAWGPYPPERHAVLRAAGQPCQYRGFHLGRLGAVCAGCHCLADITPEQVVAAAERLLARSPSPPGRG